MWDLLAGEVNRYGQIVVTPNVLTEVSNLCDFRDPKLGAAVRGLLATSVTAWVESYVPSSAATQRPEFSRLGLTDAAILTLADPGMAPFRSDRRATVLTSDAALYEALTRTGVAPVNFWHLTAALFDDA